MNKLDYKLPFEKYEIWQLAIDLGVSMYELTKGFPNEEKFGMISQISRASKSVSANIAEGTSRFSEKEKARFIEIAYGSLMEVASFLFMARRLNYISVEEFQNVKPIIGKLSNKINAFYRRLNTNK